MNSVVLASLLAVISNQGNSIPPALWFAGVAVLVIVAVIMRLRRKR
ncbi:hypothetical protein [Curtobacterium sp. SL109]|nr:hypothetical protein [Curtobacterium sp. SL109]MCY1695271.1 hypothetical protein [Curtobacterium sp. SL109]